MAKRTTESAEALKPASRSKTDSKPEVKAAQAAGAGRPPATGRLIWLCFGAWLVPGLGHFMLGRKWRALVLGAAVLATFVFGLLMKGEFFATQAGSYLETLGYFGQLCAGAPMPIARFFGYAGDPLFVSSEYGTTFLVTAGMLNVLCILDTYDIAMGRKP